MTDATVGQTSRYERKREAILEAAATLRPDRVVRRQLSDQGPLLRLSALSLAVEAMRPGLLTELGRLTEKTAGLMADGVTDGFTRPVDPEIAAQLVTGMINAAVELLRWSPMATTVADLFVQPLLTSMFTAIPGR